MRVSFYFAEANFALTKSSSALTKSSSALTKSSSALTKSSSAYFILKPSIWTAFFRITLRSISFPIGLTGLFNKCLDNLYEIKSASSKPECFQDFDNIVGFNDFLLLVIFELSQANKIVYLMLGFFSL